PTTVVTQPRIIEIKIDSTKFVDALDIEDGFKAKIDANEILFLRSTLIREAAHKKQLSSQSLAAIVGALQQFPQYVKAYGDQNKDDPYKKDSEVLNECFSFLVNEEKSNAQLAVNVQYDFTDLLKRYAVQKTDGVYGPKILNWMKDRPAIITPFGGYDKLVSEWNFTQNVMTIQETADNTDDGMFLKNCLRICFSPPHFYKLNPPHKNTKI
ncbi:MAG: hypothetical protein GY938_05095, partial [Ketobacter sp.]|nr:hypothetical protein [Ketobacter sp.]